MAFDQLLRQLSLPIPQACAIAAIGFVLLLIRRYRSGLLVIALGATWLYLCATPGFVSILRQGLESQYPTAPASTYPKVDAIVVLGGDSVPSAKLDWQDEPAKIDRNRLGFGFQLYQHGRAPIMVLTAGKGGAVKMAAALQAQGVPAKAIRIEGQAHNTHENALFTSRILRQENLQRVLLVTSPFHMPRAMAAFRKQKVDVIPAPTPLTSPALTAKNPWVPQHHVLLQSQRYLHEYIGLWMYWLRGWA